MNMWDDKSLYRLLKVKCPFSYVKAQLLFVYVKIIYRQVYFLKVIFRNT